MKKIRLLLLLMIFGINIFAQQNLQIQPTNPEYINYVQKKNAGLLEMQTVDGHILGERPSPLKRNFDNLQVNTPKGIPSAYDLRTVDGGAYLTPVKDQGLEGACWAFATYATIESYWKKQGLATFDLSEQNLATCHGFDWTPSEGGNYDLSTAYLSRRAGPISEADDPYTLPLNPSCVTGQTPVAYVAEARFLPGIDDTGYSADIIKQAIMNNGVIYCNMYFDSNYMNNSDETYYYNGSEGTNHGVAIVGWDNNKIVTGDLVSPSSTGAWIIKNSWGSGWGESGYFYISYEDTEALSSVAYFPSNIDYNSSSEVYYYDDFGAISVVGYGDGDDYGLVKYVATDNQQITMLGSYVNDAGTSITFEVYDDFNGFTLSNILGTTGVQTCIYPGYYTYELATPINISSGNDFYIKVRYNTPGETYIIPVEAEYVGYASAATIETGKCWVSGNGASWSEVGAGIIDNEYDLCIKAYAVDVATAPPIANFSSNITTATVGQTVYFTDASSGIPDNWSWTFEGGSPETSSATNPTVTWDTPGTYDVTLFVSNSQGNDEITSENYITITSAPTTCEYKDNIEASDNYPVYYPLANGYFTGPNDYNFTEFAEYYDSHINNLVTGVKLGVKHADDLTGSGYITVKIWDENGGLPDNELYSEDFYLSEFTPSAYNELTFTSSTTVPEEFFIGYQIYYTSPQDTFNVYQVENRGEGSSFPSTAYIKYSGYWENTNDAFTSSFNTSFSIYPNICPSPPTADFIADVTSGCNDLTVQFIDQSSLNTDSWYWDFGDGDISSEQNPEHYYDSPGSYTVTLTVTNPQGSDDLEMTNYIIIGANPLPVTVSGGGTQCGGTITLTASGGTGGTIYWQGATSGGTSMTTASSSEEVSSSGTYYFRSVTPLGCWSNEGSAEVIINEIPDPVTVTGGGTQCGGTMTLTASGGTGGTIYWQSTTSGGTSSATESTSENISTNGTYYFRSLSAEGCWGDEGSATVTINDVPDPVTVSGGGTQCGGTMELTTTGGAGGSVYWQGTTSGGEDTGTPSTFQVVSSSGTYFFRSQSAEGCWSDEGSAIVTINEIPDPVTVTGGGTQCGGTIILTANGGDGGTIYFQGTTSAGTSIANPSSSEEIATSGDYYFRAQSAEGCWGDEGSANVTIHPELSVTMSSTNESAPGANDGTLTLNIVGGIPDYILTSTSLEEINTSLTEYTYNDLSGGLYCVTVTDDNGCFDVECETVTTDGAAPVASFTADVTEGCDELTVSLTDLSSNNPDTWSWNFGDGSSLVADQNPTHTYDSPGIYTIALTSENMYGGNTTSYEDYIIVGETPTIDYTVTPASGELVTDGGISVSVSGGAEPYAVVWDHNAMETSLELIGLLPGTYYLTVTENNGCSDNETIVVNWVNYIKEISNELKIYPNPTDKQLNIISDNGIIKKISIYNILGELVYQKDVDSKNIEIDVKNYSIGTYVLEINMGKEIEIRKFIKH